MRVPRILAFIVLLGFASLVQAQSVIFDESTTVQQHPKKVGINLQPPAYYGANELYKNLLWLNSGFEPTLYRQKLVASVANGGGSTTSFIPELFSTSNAGPYGPSNAPDLVAANFWTGASFWLSRSGASSTQAKVIVCTGTIASNTAGTTVSQPEYTFSVPCSSAVLPGDILVLRRLKPCAVDDITVGRGGWWLPATASANSLSTDCTTPYEGKQSLVLDASSAGSTSEVDSYIDDSAFSTNGIIFNGQYTISGYYKTYSGTNPTLTVAVNRKLPPGSPGNPIHWPGSQCTNNGTFIASAAWAAFSITCSGSETSDLAPSMLKIAFSASGGAVDLDSVSFYKSAETDTTNTTVFRDEVVATLKAHCAGASLTPPGVPCEIRSFQAADGDEIDNTIKPSHLRSPIMEGFEYSSSALVSLEEFLELCQSVGAEPYITLPETMTISDAPHWIEYLYGASTTPYGALRQANGQGTPWGNVFGTIHLEMGNENWNAVFGAGFNLLPDIANSNVTPWAGADVNFDYTTDTAGIWNAMRSSPSWPAGDTAIDLVVNLQEHGWAGLVGSAMSRTGATSGEIGAYTQAGLNSVDSLSTLWQPLMYEVVAKTTNPAMAFYQMMHGYSIWPGILASGKVNIYEFDNGTVTPSSNLSQNVLDSFTDAAGYGTATALQALSNLTAGIVDQNFNGLGTYIGYPLIYKASYPVTGSSATSNIVTLQATNAFSAGDDACFAGLTNAGFLNGKCGRVLALGLSSSSFQVDYAASNVSFGVEHGASATSSFDVHHWGAAIDMGGSTTTLGSTVGATLVRPQELGLRMVNAAIIGPMYSCTVASPTTVLIDPSNQNGSEAAPTGQGYWTPPPPNSAAVPQEYAFCFMRGEQRSMILINTDVTNAHTITFSGSAEPIGEVLMTRYAPDSIAQSNEAPGTDLVTNLHPSVVIQSPVPLSSPPGDTLPPFSITRYDWTSGTTSTTTILSVNGSSAVNAGTQIFLTATVSGSPSIGSVTFMDGGTAISGPLPVVQGISVLTYSVMTVGQHTFTAAFSGAAGYSSSVSNNDLITASLIPTAATLTASSSSVSTGQSVKLTALATNSTMTALSGNVIFTLDGATALGASALNGNGVATYDATLVSAGMHTIKATYTGDSTHSSATASANVQVINQTKLTLTPTSNTAYTGQAITFNAAAVTTFDGTTVSTGAVQFSEGDSVLGVAQIVDGSATFTTSTLSSGTHVVSAHYAGDIDDNSATSNMVTETILPSSLSFTASQSSITLQSQHPVIVAITATSTGTFADSVSFAVVGLPDHVTVSFTQAQGNVPVGGTLAASFQIEASDYITSETSMAPKRRSQFIMAAWMGLGLMPFTVVFTPLRRRLSGTLLILAIGLFSMVITGCAEKYASIDTPANFILHLVATGSSTGLTRTLDIPCTVTK